MNNRDIIVIGASSGGLEVLRQLVKKLPANFPAAVFIVWHIPPDALGILPDVLTRAGNLPAANAVNLEKTRPGRIYTAPPDHHLLLENGFVRVARGPKENRFRPAIDPLFRSAAYSYGERVIGVVLTGGLDDGTAGLQTIKQKNGLAVVQDPLDADYPSMPRNALEKVATDYCVPASELPALLVKLTGDSLAETAQVQMSEENNDVNTDEKNDERNRLEVRIASEDNGFENGIMQLGDLTAYTCPECHGVLVKLQDGKIMRFRCHTGHAFSADSLLTAVSENVEESAWSAVRAIEESVMLLDMLGKHWADKDAAVSETYFAKAREANERAQVIRNVVLQHEQLSTDNIRNQSAQPS